MGSVDNRDDNESYTLLSEGAIDSADYFPDHDRELEYVLLEEKSPELSDRLRRFFAEIFIHNYPQYTGGVDDIIASTDLRTAAFPSEPGWRLRLTSRITGVTYWYVEWDGAEETAREWIEEQAGPAQADAARYDADLRRGPANET